MKYSPPALLGKKDAVKSGKLSEAKGVPSTEELLNKVIPTKHFQQENREWAQSISSDPATRLDVIALQVRLWHLQHSGSSVELKVWCSAGTARFKITAEACQRDGLVSCARRVVLSVFW